MANIVNGVLVHARVKDKLFSQLEKGQLKSVHAIIVHQTGADSAEHTFNSYKKGGNGAHFLIGKDGIIYQTARTTQKTYHVGRIKSRCYETHTCSPAESKKVKSILFEKGKSYSKRVKNLHDHEKSKSYPNRYPTNDDSIGIELVGKFDTKKAQYESATHSQISSLKWLIKELSSALGVKTAEIFRHPVVSYKQPSEASTAKW